MKERKIFEMAVDAWIPPTFDGVVLKNTETGELVGRSWTSSTYAAEGWEEVYRLRANFLANEPYSCEDFFEEEEIEKLEKLGSDGCDVQEGLELIEKEEEFYERILEYLELYDE